MADRAELERVIVETTKTIDDALATAKTGYEVRTAAWLEARELNPPITTQRLGELSGISSVAVTQALRKAKARADG